MRFAALILALAATLPARAEITSLGPTGFATAHAADVPVPAAAAFDAMTRKVGAWWSSDHTWSGAASNLYIEPRAGGCFCERLAEGGSNEHLRVVHFAPGRLVRMQGGLGPLQGMGLQGTMEWLIEGEGPPARIRWRYTVHGHLADGFADIAGAVDRVLSEQLERLAASLQED